MISPKQSSQFSNLLIANSVLQNSSSIFTCLYVCMYVCLCSSVTFLFLQTLSSRNLSHGNISQFKFRILTDYFGLVLYLFLNVLYCMYSVSKLYINFICSSKRIQLKYLKSSYDEVYNDKTLRANTNRVSKENFPKCVLPS